MSALTHQIDNRPVVVAALESSNIKLSNFPPPKPAAQQDREQRSIPLALQCRGIGQLPQLSCLLSGQPVSEADAQLFRLFTRRIPAANSGLRRPESAAS